MNRAAFTLVELMIATSVACVIAVGVFMFFSGSATLSREAYEEVSRAMADRQAREQDLFVRARLEPSVQLPFSNRWEEVSQ